MQLSALELETLESISNKEWPANVSRGHLERLSRLDLIEPCADGICLTGVGKKILVKVK